MNPTDRKTPGITREKYAAYIAVLTEGQTDMSNTLFVCHLSGLSAEEVLNIAQNLNQLNNVYPDVLEYGT